MARKRSRPKLLRKEKAPRPGSPLTPKEIKVLTLCSRGDSKEEIAEKMGISVSYVKFFFERIFLRLNATTLAHAVANGFRKGYLK